MLSCNLSAHIIWLTKFELKLAERGEEIRRSISSTSSSMRAESIAEARRNNKRGMVLPFQPLSIAFDEIRYSVDMPEVSSY